MISVYILLFWAPKAENICSLHRFMKNISQQRALTKRGLKRCLELDGSYLKLFWNCLRHAETLLTRWISNCCFGTFFGTLGVNPSCVLFNTLDVHLLFLFLHIGCNMLVLKLFLHIACQICVSKRVERLSSIGRLLFSCSCFQTLSCFLYQRNVRFPRGVPEEEIKQWRQTWPRAREKETRNICWGKIWAVSSRMHINAWDQGQRLGRRSSHYWGGCVTLPSFV